MRWRMQMRCGQRTLQCDCCSVRCPQRIVISICGEGTERYNTRCAAEKQSETAPTRPVVRSVRGAGLPAQLQHSYAAPSFSYSRGSRCFHQVLPSCGEIRNNCRSLRDHAGSRASLSLFRQQLHDHIERVDQRDEAPIKLGIV